MVGDKAGQESTGKSHGCHLKGTVGEGKPLEGCKLKSDMGHLTRPGAGTEQRKTGARRTLL